MQRIKEEVRQDKFQPMAYAKAHFFERNECFNLIFFLFFIIIQSLSLLIAN